MGRGWVATIEMKSTVGRRGWSGREEVAGWRWGVEDSIELKRGLSDWLLLSLSMELLGMLLNLPLELVLSMQVTLQEAG